MARRIALVPALAALALLPAACGSQGTKADHAASKAAAAPTRTLSLDWSVRLKPGPSVLTIDGIAVDPRGDVYVGDAGRDRVLLLDARGRTVRVIDDRTAGQRGFDFVKPGEPAADAQAIASLGLDGRGNVYVADTGHYLIEKFGPGGRFIYSWGGNGFKPGQFGEGRLVGVAPDAAGHIYATDDLAGPYTVQKYSSSGAYLARFGPKGNQPGQPTGGVGGAAVSPTGGLFLSDDHLNAVIKFSADGRLEGSFGGSLLAGPEGVAVDKDGHVLVADTGDGRIGEFTPDGHLVAWYVGSGKSAFKNPTAIAADAGGGLYVYDQDRSVLLKLERR